MKEWIEIGSGCAVEFNPDAEPEICWKHIDGPMLVMRNGQLHWLTPWERLRCWMGYDNAFTLERKYAPDFVQRWITHATSHWQRHRELNQ